MAVAALSTSAIALTASPTPTSPTPMPASPPVGEAAPAFAKLVAQTQPEGKPGQGAPNPEAGAEAEGEIIAIMGDETSPGAPESRSQDAGADQPLDLLAGIEAMVAAAGQIIVAQPTPAPAAQDGAAPAEPVLVGRTITRLAANSAPAMPLRPPATAAQPETPPADRTGEVLPQPKDAARAPVDSPARHQAPAAATLPDARPVPTADTAKPFAADAAGTRGATEAAPVADDATAPARPAARGNIATLIASLKSAFTPGRMPADAPIPAAAAEPGAAPVAAMPLPDATAMPAPETVAAAVTPEALAAEPAPQPKAGKPARAPAAPPIATAIATAAVPAAAKADVAAPQASAAPAPADTDQPIAPTGGDQAPVAATAATPAPASPAMPTAPAVDPALAGVQPAGQPVVGAAPADGAAPAVSEGLQTVERHLDLARDSQWLDRLARDISQAATQQGHLKFHLNPEHLGALTVEIANSAAGTAIKLTADTDQARTIIADAQPQLIAEVRAQGLRVSETHVELNNQQQSGANHGSAFAQNQQGQTGQQRQPSADHQPFARTQATSRDDAGDSAPREDGELYA